jgi:hypothetical protein
VIAGDAVDRKRDRGKKRLEASVGGAGAVVGQISGGEDQLRLPGIAAHLRQESLQRRVWMVLSSTHVDVGDLDDA